MLSLTPAGAVILTSRLLTHGRTPEEVLAKLHRPNFMHRVNAVSAVLADENSYPEAAAALVKSGWFTGLSQTDLAAAMEAEANDLMAYATSLGLPVDGLVASKPQTDQTPVEPELSETDIPM